MAKQPPARVSMSQLVVQVRCVQGDSCGVFFSLSSDCPYLPSAGRDVFSLTEEPGIQRPASLHHIASAKGFIPATHRRGLCKAEPTRATHHVWPARGSIQQ